MQLTTFTQLRRFVEGAYLGWETKGPPPEGLPFDPAWPTADARPPGLRSWSRHYAPRWPHYPPVPRGRNVNGIDRFLCMLDVLVVSVCWLGRVGCVGLCWLLLACLIRGSYHALLGKCCLIYGWSLATCMHSKGFPPRNTVFGFPFCW